MQKELSIKDALEQGYTKYLFNQEGFQRLLDISDIHEEELLRDDIRLVQIEPYSPNGISSKDIAELLAEHLDCQHSDESGDDTTQVYDAIKGLDFTEAENKITEALSKLNYYKATDIKLVANPQVNPS